jgi:hypothetical protein
MRAIDPENSIGDNSLVLGPIRIIFGTIVALDGSYNFTDAQRYRPDVGPTISEKPIFWTTPRGKSFLFLGRFPLFSSML